MTSTCRTSATLVTLAVGLSAATADELPTTLPTDTTDIDYKSEGYTGTVRREKVARSRAALRLSR